MPYSRSTPSDGDVERQAVADRLDIVYSCLPPGHSARLALTEDPDARNRVARIRVW